MVYLNSAFIIKDMKKCSLQRLHSSAGGSRVLHSGRDGFCVYAKLLLNMSYYPRHFCEMPFLFRDTNAPDYSQFLV